MEGVLVDVSAVHGYESLRLEDMDRERDAMTNHYSSEDRGIRYLKVKCDPPRC